MRTALAVLASVAMVAGASAYVDNDQFDGRAPHCEEDEVMHRVSVPGPWSCIPADEISD